MLRTPYFPKFMRTSEGPVLYRFYIEQLEHIAWSRDDPTTFHRSLMLLMELTLNMALFHANSDPLPRRACLKLNAWIYAGTQRSLKAFTVEVERAKREKRDWDRLRGSPGWSHSEIAQCGSNLLSLLHGRLSPSEFMREMRILAPWLTCGAKREHCADGHPIKERGRRQCGRCGTVVYCCKEHQRLDWPGHKLRCFETNY
ncbi:hypothetical protein C8R43DRAFT_554848 [Mycena crocata]|nr:hypothetical protein C8R43DRAFT_554848 [Mycena crocata]